MPVPIFDSDNVAIDNLVQLANANQGNHAGEVLLVPPQNEEQELINDAPLEEEPEPRLLNIGQLITVRAFSQPASRLPSDAVIAVDAGIVNLGELALGGVAFAVRGAAVCYPPNNGKPFICRYNTGALVIDAQNQLPLLHYMGRRLGRDDKFVAISSTPPYYSLKQGIADTSNQIRDRFRNFVERMIQEEAIAILESFGGGILLIDGALSGETYDTPEEYINSLLAHCHQHRIHVTAISKKTRITVGGRTIANLFYEQEDFIGYAPLRQILQQERQASLADNQSVRSIEELSVADEIYAVRFSYAPPGLTFRTDVKPAFAYLPSDVIEQVYSRCQIYGGYPRPLIEAHQYSSFLSQDKQLFLVDVIVQHGVRPQEEPSMDVLFQPFGGGFK
ncbi:MAG: DNA double-strand break repair nuclease NurA [Phormidium sp.]